MIKIGILGGSGAFGKTYLLNKILESASLLYGASTDSDYPYLVVYNSPLEQLDENGLSHDLTLHNIKLQIKEMETIGCTYIAIACNTLHKYYDELSSCLLPTTKLINILELLQSYISINFSNVKNIALLSSQHSKDIQLHARYLNNYSICYTNEQQQNYLNKSIKKIISNKLDNEDLTIFKETLDKIQYNDLIVIACTELSILNSKTNHLYLNVIDTCDILAKYINELHFNTNLSLIP